MKVVSLNRSVIKTVTYQGEPLATGIFKQPTTETVFVGRQKLDGDEQADLVNHGGESKAVYAFGANHYPYWREVLGRELAYGAFGENLTITDLVEKDIAIGDQFRIGSCVLEVSQPRVPCFKFGIALANVKAPKLFTKTFNTGVYFRVLEEGTITPGDDVVRLRKQANLFSTHDLFAAVFDKNHGNPKPIIAQALSHPALSNEWREMLNKKLAQL